MNRAFILALKALRKIYNVCKKGKKALNINRVNDADAVSDMIYHLLSSDKPCMIARFGSTELNCLNNYLSVSSKHHNAFKFISGEEASWWWNPKGMRQMRDNAGFFPLSEETLSQFSVLMLDDIKELDLLGSWYNEGEYIIRTFIDNVPKVLLLFMEPYWSSKPWSKILEGKKVLVIHPFAKLIEEQYHNHRTNLFKNPDVLPLFDLLTIEAVQSIGGESNGFSDWFEALHWMEDEMDKCDYDIVLIGCGAYGFPLAAHAKRMGKKAVHLGGALQLLFGIKGKRWENPAYGFKEFGVENKYKELFNEYWVRPDSVHIPVNAAQVEGGCYW